MDGELLSGGLGEDMKLQWKLHATIKEIIKGSVLF